MRYAVVHEKTLSSYSAYVPDLPGSLGTGRTREEVEHRIREAIELHVEELRREGEPVPEPTSWTALVEA